MADCPAPGHFANSLSGCRENWDRRRILLTRNRHAGGIDYEQGCLRGGAPCRRSANWHGRTICRSADRPLRISDGRPLSFLPGSKRSSAKSDRLASSSTTSGGEGTRGSVEHWLGFDLCANRTCGPLASGSPAGWLARKYAEFGGRPYDQCSGERQSRWRWDRQTGREGGASRYEHKMPSAQGRIRAARSTGRPPAGGNNALAERPHHCDREWITTTGGEAARPH
jgi:hypothetical protein